jgi:hypothetical protein
MRRFGGPNKGFGSKDQGRQTVPEQWRGNGAQRNDLAIAEAEGALAPEAHTDLLCEMGPNFFANYGKKIMTKANFFVPKLAVTGGIHAA